MLDKKDRLQTTEGKRIRIIDYVGDGGQGEVYRVEVDGSKDYALKWYFPHNAVREQLELLKVLVKIGSPDSRFLWPIAIVSHSEKPEYFGYLMRFRPSNYKPANKLLDRSIEPSFYAIMTACYQLSDSFLQLHAKGLSYKDISINNIFIEPETGNVLICDNDNVAYEGIEYSAVGGTPAFMAPEIVRGEVMPNKYTDLYSLSILLFFILYISHPLDGKRESAIHAKDEAAFRLLYGTDPIYIFHPTDKRNIPDPEFHSNAYAFHEIYPQSLKDTFERAFTAGVNEPSRRVEESVWRGLFIALRDNIVGCDKCGTESFYDIEQVKKGEPTVCWSCNTKSILPARMRINNDVIILNHSIKLYPHHTSGILFDFTKTTAEISEHPTLKIKGLRNLSDDVWYITKNDKSVVQVPPGRSFALENGIIVKFGLVNATIRI